MAMRWRRITVTLASAGLIPPGAGLAAQARDANRSACGGTSTALTARPTMSPRTPKVWPPARALGHVRAGGALRR